MKVLQVAIFVLLVFIKAFGQESLANLPDSLGVYSNADLMPEYKGGELELYSFIRSILVYPKMEMDSGIEGRVFVRFIVDEKGQANHPVVVKGVSAGIDREAVNAVLQLKDFIPAREKGKKVKAYLTVPITFQIKYVQGSSDDKASLKSDVLTFADQMPEFPGGDAALIKFLQSNIVYPQMERDNDIQGKVLIRFVVGEDGTVSDVSIVRGVSSGLDREAQRVVKMLPKFNPGKRQGKAVKVYYNIPVVFKLQDSKPKKSPDLLNNLWSKPDYPVGDVGLLRFIQMRFYNNMPITFNIKEKSSRNNPLLKAEIDKNFKSAYTNYAFEKYEDAIKYFKKSIIEFPFDYMSYELKGECEMALGNTDRACKDFRLALQNGSPTATNLLEKNCK